MVPALWVCGTTRRQEPGLRRRPVRELSPAPRIPAQNPLEETPAPRAAILGCCKHYTWQSPPASGLRFLSGSTPPAGRGRLDGGPRASRGLHTPPSPEPPASLSARVLALLNKVAPASGRLWKESSVIKSCESGIVSIVNPSH